MPHVDEIESVERWRSVSLAISGLLSFLVFTYFGVGPFSASFYALGVGLIFSGCLFAYRVTREVPWASVLAEQRLGGGHGSKLRIWLGGIIPGVVALALGCWWHPLG